MAAIHYAIEALNQDGDMKIDQESERRSNR
jgi:hypothetical protein